MPKEFEWECEHCGKVYDTKEECDKHEDKCREERIASILAPIGILLLFIFRPSFGITIVMAVIYIYYSYKLHLKKIPPKHKDWPWVIIVLFIIQIISITYPILYNITFSI